MPPLPVVAIHVSELTQALEPQTASPPTPSGSGTTGKQWFLTSWHYFVAYETLKEVLRSDGTPFVTVSDAQIAAGTLLQGDGSPRYPIVFSLASEAIADDEILPLRDYVNAGGFLFAGASAFTRNTNGTTRGNFALASEMGIRMAQPALTNWALNNRFTRSINHPVVSGIPGGTLVWRMPLTSEETPLGISPSNNLHSNHYVWRVVSSNATVLASGGTTPLLTVKPYGKGQFIYHAALQPLLGHGGFDSSMYSYLIFRNSINWAFESAGLPVARVSPWPYAYDAAYMVRHDFENIQSFIRLIETSAAFEKSHGVRGEYYFCTGTLREHMTDKLAVVASLRRAVTNSGAIIGPHNGGLKNPNHPNLPQTDYGYWHWGPDEAYDITPSGYPSGLAYATASVSNAFQDVDGWLVGLDHGPRVWAAPAFNSTRENSYSMMQQLGAVSMGEQKIGPFPHWTLSTQTAGKRYSHISLPLSEWYVGNEVVQGLDDHSSATMRAAFDFYLSLGSLINLYSHLPSQNNNVVGDYIKYASTNSTVWAANAVDLHQWWMSRSNAAILPVYSRSGLTSIVHVAVTGASHTNTTVEVAIPGWSGNSTGGLQVLFNGLPAPAAAVRNTRIGVKARVGTNVQALEVRYLTPPLSTIWPSSAVPTLINDPDTSPSEVGLKFQSTQDGFVHAIRFYKGPANAGPHVGHLWTSNGTLLASVTFSNETVAGWQQQALPNPVAITSNTTYVVSYYAPTGGCSADTLYFSSSGYTNHPLVALPNTVPGGNGVGRDGMGFPTNTWLAANYWVDVVFEGVDVGPVAFDQTVTLQEDTVTNLTLSATGGGGVLSYGILTDPTNGVLSGFNASSGAVSYTPDADYYGGDSFRFTVQEGSLTATGTVHLTIGAVNDAPTLTLASNNVVVLEDSGLVTLAGLATFTPGPANESAQTITNVAILSLSDATLFAVGPSVSPEGTLSFTPAADRHGVAGVTIQAQDDGGSAQGGTNGSAAATFTITINAVNDAPVVANPIPDQFGMYGAAFEYEFDASTFADVDGDVLAYTVLGLPPELGFDGELRLFSGVPGQAGAFAVAVVAADDGFPSLSVTNQFTLTIAKAPATVWLNELEQTYDGTARGVRAETEPEELVVIITYDGGPQAPTNAGSYQAVGTINDANHAGAATNTLTVSPAALTASAHDAVRWFGAPDPVFSGSITGVQAGDDITAGYSTTATAASPPGSYNIVPALVDPGNRLGNYEVTLHHGWLTILGAPRLLSIAEAPEGGFKLLWEVHPQRSYEFQFKDQLAAGNWIAKTQFTTAVNEMSVELEDEPGAEEQRFYRLVDVTPP